MSSPHIRRYFSKRRFLCALWSFVHTQMQFQLTERPTRPQHSPFPLTPAPHNQSYTVTPILFPLLFFDFAGTCMLLFMSTAFL